MSSPASNALPIRPRSNSRGKMLPPWNRDPRRFPDELLVIDPWVAKTLASGFC